MPAMVEDAKMDAKEKKGTKKVVKRKSVDKWKRKKWFSILAPTFFNEHALGETIAEEGDQVVSRVIESNAADVTKQAKLRHIHLSFRVTKTQAQKAFTEFKGHEIQEGYLRRFVRRRSSKIDVVEDVLLKSGEKVRVKAISITNRKASRAQETEIRKLMRKEIHETAVKKNLDQFVQEMIFGNLSSAIFKETKRVMPVKRVEIHKSLVLNQKRS